MLIAEAISKSYGQLNVLDELSAEFHCGDVNVIMGSSGSGKSTLLKILAGVDSPTSGFFGHRAATDILSYMPQGDSLLPWLDTKDNVLVPLRVGRAQRLITSTEQQRAQELLLLFGLAKFANARPFELSGGMKQRVALARSLITEPDILLLDEPFSALDDPTRIRIEGVLRSLVQKRNLICILVTHNVDQAIGIGDEVALLTGSPARLNRALHLPKAKRPLSALDYGVARQALLEHIHA